MITLTTFYIILTILMQGKYCLLVWGKNFRFTDMIQKSFEMRKIQCISLCVFFLSAIGYIISIHLRPYPGSFIIISIPALSLSVFALSKVPGLRGKLLFAALMFSSAGDFTIELNQQGTFIAGLGFFLFAHIFYIILFSIDFRPRKSKIPIVIFLVVYALK